MSADIGVIGLAVMGENLVLNFESHGYTVAVNNRTTTRIDEFLASKRAKEKKIIGAHTLPELVKVLKKPRKILLMVRAGDVVDDYIQKLTPLLEKGDIIIDGGNSHYPDTNRRTRALEKLGFLYLGVGVSGGEEGALKGPSIMPGGSKPAWEIIKPIFQSIAAEVDGSPCCDWVGEEGAGHFVKMVHNGIEYGDMQLIAEAYHLIKDLLKYDNDKMADVFEEWNKGKLDSYLIEITYQILRKKDEDGKTHLVDVILDSAGQKGTGKWTAQVALDLGIPVTLIAEAVFARCLSSLKDARVHASKILTGPTPTYTGDHKELLDAIRDALYASKLVSYAQGFSLMNTAASEFKWKLNYGGVALMWRGGCIIRSTFLGKIKDAYDSNPNLENLLLDPFFQEKMSEAQNGWRKVCSLAVLNGIPVPAMTTALSYFDGYRTVRLPANLTQAQRDYFGAHTFERVDKPRGEFFHANWTGHGGDTHSHSYTL